VVHLVQFESQWRHVRIEDLAEDAPQLGQGILGADISENVLQGSPRDHEIKCSLEAEFMNVQFL
jgi:hypothetical protein